MSNIPSIAHPVDRVMAFPRLSRANVHTNGDTAALYHDSDLDAPAMAMPGGATMPVARGLQIPASDGDTVDAAKLTASIDNGTVEVGPATVVLAAAGAEHTILTIPIGAAHVEAEVTVEGVDTAGHRCICTILAHCVTIAGVVQAVVDNSAASPWYLPIVAWNPRTVLVGSNLLVKATPDATYQTRFTATARIKLSDTTGLTPLAAGTRVTIATLTSPTGLAWDGTRIMVADNAVLRALAPDGTATTVANVAALVRYLCFDGSDYYATNGVGSELLKITPAGVVSTHAAIAGFASSVCWDGANFYVPRYIDNKISKVTPGGVVTDFAVGLANPVGITWDGNNFYVVNDGGGGTISKVTPGGVVTEFVGAAGGLSGPSDITWDGANFYVSNVTNDTISKVTPAGVVSAFSTGFGNPLGVVTHAGYLYVADNGATTIVRVAT